MPTDHYLEIFNLLDLYIHERSVNETFSELGGIGRDLPLLDNAVVKSCHISHYLSNDLEQRWIRALHVTLTSSLPVSSVHDRFRTLVNGDLSITFANDNETVLCTDFSREVLKAEAFDASGSTDVFLSSQLSGFDENEALNFLINPLHDLGQHDNKSIRLVVARSSRSVTKGQSADRVLEQRWTAPDITLAMQSMVEAADGDRWTVEHNLKTTEAGPTARLRHVPSSDLISLDSVMGYGQLELRASC